MKTNTAYPEKAIQLFNFFSCKQENKMKKKQFSDAY